MRIIDARSGKDVQVGDVVDYGYPRVFTVPPSKDAVEETQRADGAEREWWKLRAVRSKLLSAEALIEYHSDGLVSTRWVPLTVRFFHPKFLFQRVAFVPS